MMASKPCLATSAAAYFLARRRGQISTVPKDRGSGRVLVGEISISHPERVIYPDLGLTKLDIARYYDTLADRMLPHVAGRPLTLLRCAGPIDLILIDVMRNNRTNTSVSAYSLRARKGAPVSTPIEWDELDGRFDPAAFTLARSRRHARGDRDPWAGYWTMRQRLPAP